MQDGTKRTDSMSPHLRARRTVSALDDDTRRLVRLAAVIAVGSEPQVRQAFSDAVGVDPIWVEEVILQSYLFAGFPRTLNAAREWRRISGRQAPAMDADARHDRFQEWRVRGEKTCATVYGPFYERLRHNIRQLHPALDDWMVVDGYGKVIGRPGLDLERRELCIIAVCASAAQDRQLHSHLYGALHSGATPDDITATIAAVEDLIPPAEAEGVWRLWEKVLATGHAEGLVGLAKTTGRPES